MRRLWRGVLIGLLLVGCAGDGPTPTRAATLVTPPPSDEAADEGFHWQLGTVGEWVAGIGAVIAAAVAVGMPLYVLRRERRNVALDIRVIERRAPDEEQPGEYWWRITAVGGNSYSRAEMTKLDWVQEHGRVNVLALTGSNRPLLLVPGQTVHLHGVPPALTKSFYYRVDVEWTVEGKKRTDHRRWVFIEPWT